MNVFIADVGESERFPLSSRAGEGGEVSSFHSALIDLDLDLDLDLVLNWEIVVTDNTDKDDSVHSVWGEDEEWYLVSSMTIWQQHREAKECNQ